MPSTSASTFFFNLLSASAMRSELLCAAKSDTVLLSTSILILAQCLAEIFLALQCHANLGTVLGGALLACHRHANLGTVLGGVLLAHHHLVNLGTVLGGVLLLLLA